MKRSFLFLALIGLSLSWATAQSSSRIKEQAKAYFAAEHFESALNTFRSSRQLERSDEESRFLIAICRYQLNRLEEAKASLIALTEEERSPYPECWLYLGKIFHAQHQFDAATRHYKMYLRTLRPEHPNRAMVIEEIRRCDNGLRLLYREAKVVVENLGPSVNTAADEFAPVVSPNRSTRLYFSAIRPGNVGGARDEATRPDPTYGHFMSDMFSTQLRGGQWQPAEPMHYLLNSPQHEQLIGFSGQGKVLLYYQGWNWERGTIFADTFQQTEQRTLTTTPLVSAARPDLGEQALHLFNDTLLIFAARRADGYGGLDLYRSSLRNGYWTSPENLGPQINSSYDETTPFLARNGSTLYFSTNDSRRSVGGLDVVRSVYLPEATRWSEAENLGFPINSAGDDAYFSLARDGFTGFFASSRKDGVGERDLYVAYFTTYRQEMEPVYVSAPIQSAPPSSGPILSQPDPVTPPANNSPVSSPPSISPSNPSLPASSVWQWQGATLGDLRTAATASSATQQTIQTLQQNPAATVVVSCYVPTGNSLLSEALFASIREGEFWTNELIRQGVQPGQIFLRALTHPESDYRMQVSFANVPATTKGAVPQLGEGTAASSGQIPANAALCFKVQIVSVQKSYRNADLNKRAGVMVEHRLDFPYYRYTIGASSSLAEAQRLRNELARSGYDGAYVVPYVHGRRIDTKEARRLVGQFPALRAYID